MFSSSGSQIDSGAGGFSSSQTTDSSLSSAKSRDAQPMVPVTVKQISDAVPFTDDKSSFLIDGFDVKHVMLVGMSFNKSERVTDVSFFIDDGTGRIGCHRWVNDPVDTNEGWDLCSGSWAFERLSGQKAATSLCHKFSSQYSMGGLKGIDKMVIEYLEQPSSVETIESLESEGLVYSTIDECHYKSTSSG
ncbi:hypothetical protein ACH5RR_006319 [Cinchona calisaya]|uniref:Uncharacterized protein n=1 Tax=Cinchona calisaya TaxID=153742 RepID=A0ABD3ANN3_9GENT